MRLKELSLVNFRNIAEAKLSFESDRNFFLGTNGQGKTNILEAIALAHALRSFRSAKLTPLIREGTTEATARLLIQHEKRGETTLGVSINPTRRVALLDGVAVKSAEEMLGLFPVVALTLADRALIYGGHPARREEIDGLISQLDTGYFRAMEDYNKANKSRNALLTHENLSGRAEEFAAFEAIMETSARRLIKSRLRALELLRPIFQKTFADFCPAEEIPDIIYEPNATAEELPELWKTLRGTKDAALGYASRGPHRDHYSIMLNGAAAELFASEGQKFSIVLALKLAGVMLLEEKLGLAPILVADDLLLELDASRQERFWASVSKWQVFASGTSEPKTDHWKIWNVKNAAVSQTQSSTAGV